MRAGGTDSRDLTCFGVDPSELACREVLEEVFVVRVSEHVLKRGHLAQVAGAFLHIGADRGPRCGGSRTTSLGHEDSEDVAVIGEPGDGVAEYVVQASAGDCIGLAGGGVGDPELDAIIDVAGERDFLAVVGPFGAVDACPAAVRCGARGSRRGVGCSGRCNGRVVAGSRFAG